MRRIDAHTGLRITEKFDAARIVGIDHYGNTFGVQKPTEEGIELAGGKIGDHIYLCFESPGQAAIREAHEEALMASRSTLSITHNVSEAVSFSEHGRTAIALFPAVTIDRGHRRIHTFFFYTPTLSALPFLPDGDAIGGEEVKQFSIADCFRIKHWSELLETPPCPLKDMGKVWPHTLLQPSHAFYFWMTFREIAAQGLDFSTMLL